MRRNLYFLLLITVLAVPVGGQQLLTPGGAEHRSCEVRPEQAGGLRILIEPHAQCAEIDVNRESAAVFQADYDVEITLTFGEQIYLHFKAGEQLLIPAGKYRPQNPGEQKLDLLLKN